MKNIPNLGVRNLTKKLLTHVIMYSYVVKLFAELIFIKVI